ncbi:HAMP domain-containing sensor histidine kinase [Muricauda sp. 334s03]|uniref:histidine kinase n=1 Tax=Flagellimonas yonaguniensis TaxID=3031325 RepID=A0ABT5XZW0_9FLAO|nr:HAMP domain-containing sensor histidine kinase [[Muricauda] yonaguniensis]MDF0716734.1 HAMP domain-containing sensor histidine kinase [[Muricauda] yonaguniensis]
MLTKRNLYVIVFVIAVVGLLVVQYQYLRVGLGLAKAQFSDKMDRARQNINSELSEVNSLTYTLGNAIQKDTSEVNIGLDSLEKASQYYLNDYISYQLNVSGIDAPFSYTLYSRDSITYLSSVKPHLKADENLTYPIQIKGYLPELLEKEVVLEIGFEDLNNYFLGQIRGLIIPGLLFLLMIVIVVVWVLRSFYLQRSINTTTNDFINNLTHELKTPVFSIGLASKILEDDVPDNKKAVVDMIRAESNRLKKHIDKVLELASMESGKKLLQFKEIDFRPDLVRICEGFALLAQYEEIEFDYELGEGPYYIRAEQFHLENVVGNLLENARKYSDDPKIKLTAYIQKGRLLITISDNGQGIAEEDTNKIFRKYFRIKNGDVHKVKGYGLGLYYVQKIIKMHRGKISVESKLGEGTTFTISLKLTKHG